MICKDNSHLRISEKLLVEGSILMAQVVKQPIKYFQLHVVPQAGSLCSLYQYKELWNENKKNGGGTGICR